MTVQNSLTKKQDTFSMFIGREGAQKLINTALGSNSHKFTTSIISAVANNPELQKCEFQTILSGALLGESLKLSSSPQLGQFYLVPFNDKKNNRMVATPIVGYRGYLQLAMRSGHYADIDVIEIRQGEFKGRNKTNGKPVFEFIEDYNEAAKRPVVGYMAYFEMLNGFKKSIYWTKEAMEAHALQYSQSYKMDKQKGWNYSYWSKNFQDMAFKTLLRQLISKWGIMSIELQQAYINDTAILEENKAPQYIDTIETEPIQDQSAQVSEKVENQKTKGNDPFDVAD